MLYARVLYWGDAGRLWPSVHDALRFEFGFDDVMAQNIGALIGADVSQGCGQCYVLDILFSLAERMETDRETLILMLAPATLITPFGYRIAGETRGRCIVVSSLSVTSRNLSRLLRHEVGHYFGLSEHLNCVMSPYAVEDPRFCGTCIHTLCQLGVDWHASD